MDVFSFIPFVLFLVLILGMIRNLTVINSVILIVDSNPFLLLKLSTHTIYCLQYGMQLPVIEQKM